MTQIKSCFLLCLKRYISLSAVIVLFISGCETVNPIASSSEKESEVSKYVRLYSAVQPDYHPTEKNVYYHDGKGISIFQAQIQDSSLKEYPGPLYAHLARDDHFHIILVITQTAYCDDEFLRPGHYVYSGTYQYETKKKMTKTVRSFIKIPYVDDK